MFVRVYYSGCFKDIHMRDFCSLSIGSAMSDDFRITDSDLAERHIVLENINGIVSARCNGEVYLNGEKITNAVMTPSQIFILSKKHRISMLVIKEYQSDGWEVTLPTDSVVSIGRNPDNRIAVGSAIVSGTHAQIDCEMGSYYLRDSKSMNGTYVNTRRTDECRLNDGDEIVIGDAKFIYRDGRLLVYGSRLIFNGVEYHKPEKKQPAPLPERIGISPEKLTALASRLKSEAQARRSVT